MTLPYNNINDIRKKGLEEINALDALNKRYRMFNSLSSKERNAFITSQAKKLAHYLGTANEQKAAEALYNNRKFIDRFGLKAFNSLNDGTLNSYNIRKNLLQQDYQKQKGQNATNKAALIQNTFKNVFGKDSNFEDLVSGLDDQGKIDLLKNKSYLSSNEISNTLKQNAKETQEDANKRRGLFSTFSFNNIGNTNTFELYNQNRKANTIKSFQDMEDKNKSILEKLYNQTQKRRESSVSGLANDIYAKLLEQGSNGKTSLKQLYDNFDTIAKESSPYYAQFKDSPWLKEYTNEDKLKDYAKLMALSQKYGDGVAITYLDRSIQNRVAKAQDWVITGNTLKGVVTTAISDLGGQVAVANALKSGDLFDPEAMGLINQGLTPIRDKNGKIIGSKKNDNIWSNPAYWNDMYMYNTFSPTEIELIKQRGGVSKDVNVREYGWNPSEHFISFDTAYEGIKQGGHIIAAMLESGAGGIVGKTMGAAGKLVGITAMRAAGAMNAGSRTLSVMSKVGNVISKGATKTHNLAMKGIASLNGPQGEAMGTFNEQLEHNKEAINDQIKKELKQYYNNIDFNSKEAINTINDIYKKLKVTDLKRIKTSAREGAQALPMSDKTLMQQAKQMYANSLLKNEEQRLQTVHAKDMQEAATNAAKTYMTNWAMDWGKEIALTHAVKKFKVAKGSLMGDVDNAPLKHFMADVKTGGVKRAVNNAGKEIKNLSARNMAKAGAKQVAGGFADEYFDGINANFSEAAGSNAFKQYINNQYDPNTYYDTMEGLYGNLISGINGAMEGVTNRENLYEGFIGAVTPFTSFMPNVGSVFTYNPKQIWNAVIRGKDMNGKKINAAERASYLINNPLLYEYSELKNKDRILDANIQAINDIVKSYKENGTIDDAAKAMSATRGYSTGYTNTDENHPVSSIMAAEDNKLFDAFNLMSVAKTLENVNGGTKSALYEQTMARLKGLAEGKLSDKEMEEEVTQFLSDPDNKSILDNNTPEQARVVAEGRLRKNAQFFMDLYKKKEEIETKLSNSSSLKNKDPRLILSLEYQLLAKDNWKERLKTLEEETGVSYTNAEQEYNPNLEMIYGSHTSRERALRSRVRETEKIANTRLKLQNENIQSEKTIESLKEQLVNAKTEEEKNDIKEKIEQEGNLIASRKLRNNQLKIQLDVIREEVKTLKNLINNTKGNPVLDTSSNFTVDGILNSDARTRAEILNDVNRGRYTQKQLAIIDKAKAKLLEQDPEALQKIQDAGELAHRIEDSNRIYNTLLNNSDIATAYFDAQAELRNRKAIMESLQQEIDTHYKELDNVLDDENSTDTNIRNVTATLSSSLIKSYMDDHPNSVPKLKNYYDLAKFDEDAASIIMGREEPDDVKETRFRSLILIQSLVNNKEDLIKKLEETIDDDNIAEDVKDFFNDLLDKMQMLGHQRNATIVESREKRKKRDAEEKAKRAKEQAEREAKEEEERKKQEAKKKAEGSDSDEESLIPTDDNTEEPLVPSDESLEQPLVPDNTFSISENPDIASTGEGITEIKSESIDLGEQSFVNSIMSDDVEDGDVDAGEMWHSTFNGPRKGVFSINKRENTLTFNIDGNNATLTLSSNDFNSKENKNKSFIATSLEKKKDGWYFNGNFVGSKEQTQVKARDDFNLEKAINKQKEANERLYIKQGKGTSSRVITDAEGDTTVRSETIAEQAAGLSDEEKRNQIINTTDNISDTPTLNTVGETINESNSVMSGNGMSEWKMGIQGDHLLDEEGILEHKKGAEENDHMNQFYAWTEEQGWHIQNIIDRELGQILLANPKAKFKFMSVTDNDVSDNTKDSRVFTDWFLVLDYDESINKGITTVHHKENGGVINVNGKRYLVVGTVYQKSKYNEATSRNLLFNTDKRNSGVKAAKVKHFGEESQEAQDGYGVVFTERGEYIKQHPNERFFVSEKYSTEIVPNSLIPGYMVKRQENDTEEVHRTLEELLNDKERNPFGYTLETIPIAIQMMTDFYINHNVGMGNTMFPRNAFNNMGAAFVLFPASNGKYFCAHIDPLMYVEMKEGSLKDKAMKSISKLCSVNYNIRMEAIRELSDIFYFDPRKEQNGNFILTHEGSNTITFVNRGRKEMPIKVTESLDSQVIFNAFAEMNPRVNITMFNLENKEAIKELNDAGALNINLAQLALAGSSYSVYGVNLDGSLNKPSKIDSFEPSGAPFDRNKRVIIYDNTEEGDVVQYVYNQNTGKYTLNGEPLNEEKDAKLIKELNYNRKKIEGTMPFICRMHSDEYYIADANTPIVVRIDENTHHVEELSEEDSQNILNKFKKNKKDKSRKKAADVILEKLDTETFDGETPFTQEEMDKAFEETLLELYITEEEDRLALMRGFGPKEYTTQGDNSTEEKDPPMTLERYAIRKSMLLDEGASSISFKELFKQQRFRDALINICKTKWENFPNKSSKIEQYLRDKNIDVDNIPNSDEGIQALLDTIKNCR